MQQNKIVKGIVHYMKRIREYFRDIERRKGWARFLAGLQGILTLAMCDSEWDWLEGKWMHRFGILVW